MTLKIRILLAGIAWLTLIACGMTANIPPSDGQLPPQTVNTATPSQQIAPEVLITESVFVVTADSLQIRPCPYKEDLTCPPFENGFVAGDVVMGYCRDFADGSIWLEFDGNKYAAIFYDGEWYMEGNCQWVSESN